jgi:putative endonuclease
MTKYTKKLGYIAEQIVGDYYSEQGCTILKHNYTIKGGEIDIIAQSDKQIIFIEVKSVNHINNLHNYVTQKKLYRIQKTIDNFLYHYQIPQQLSTRLDIVFVKHNTIIEVFTNIEC